MEVLGQKFQNTALLRLASLHEFQMADLCRHAFCPHGHGTNVHGPETQAQSWAQD